MSRLFVAIAALLALAAIGQVTALGNESLGFPELSITVRPDGVIIPEELVAGRYLVTVENELGQGTAISFVRPPAGYSLAEAQAALADPDAAADWLYGATFVGGPHAPAGGRGQGIIDLTPGEWLIWSGEQGPVPLPTLTVRQVPAGETPADPDADVTLEVREYAFAGLAPGVAAGPQLWRITNRGEQPHLMDLLRGPGPVTFEQIMALLAVPDGATPPAGVPPAEEFTQVAGFGTTSPGQTTWIVVPDLTPGTYVALCFVPDREYGAPHAAMGMVEVFTVDEPE
jgi:hypothetical protein